MKKTFRTIAYIALAALAFGCAKAVTEGPNAANIRYFEAWMKLNHPDLKPTGLGIYIIPEEEVEGTGAEVKKDGFVYMSYTVTDLEGNISAYTEEETAKKLGEYSRMRYYGPEVLTTTPGTIQAGINEALEGMKVGGHRRVIIPNWLMSYNVYDSAEKYREASTTASHTICDITITDYADSINTHEVSLIEKFIRENPLNYEFDSRMSNDTTGFYYQPIEEGLTDVQLTTSSKIYIKYTGRLLNGTVFDSNDEKTAKDNGIYSTSKSYEPLQVNWGEEYTDITLGSGSSSVVPGFAMTIWKMHPQAKGIGIFFSPLGYSYQGSGATIPGYAPLIFEIELVEASN